MTSSDNRQELERISARACEGEMEIYSRVVGYYRPTNQWNPGKKEEFALRKTFEADKKAECCIQK